MWKLSNGINHKLLLSTRNFGLPKKKWKKMRRKHPTDMFTPLCFFFDYSSFIVKDGKQKKIFLCQSWKKFFYREKSLKKTFFLHLRFSFGDIFYPFRQWSFKCFNFKSCSSNFFFLFHLRWRRQGREGEAGE